jgi:AraC-like DNA-binding protein
MLSNFEKRIFENNENIWIRKYKNLKNILHWHFEYEIISVLSGNANVKISSNEFATKKGDVLISFPNELHYINANDESLIEIIIFSVELPKELSTLCLLNPKISDYKIVNDYIQAIKNELAQKDEFYTQKTKLLLLQMLIDIFRTEKTTKKPDEENDFFKNLITKINENFSNITFDEAAKISGYTPTYFSRMFKRLSNMTFSEYLNYIKVEKAVSLIKEKKMSVTEISSHCGFSTIRNFNRVFKTVTGFTPSTLPKDFTLNTPINSGSFNPTNSSSKLL